MAHAIKQVEKYHDLKYGNVSCGDENVLRYGKALEDSIENVWKYKFKTTFYK
jgi:hypothetical protein